MPSYKVVRKGFFCGRIYDPEGKRPVLHTDKPFPKGKNKKEKVPSWLELMKTETSSQKNKREETEVKAAAADVKKAKEDQKEIQEASFLGEGEQSTSTVETL